MQVVCAEEDNVDVAAVSASLAPPILGDDTSPTLAIADASAVAEAWRCKLSLPHLSIARVRAMALLSLL